MSDYPEVSRRFDRFSSVSLSMSYHFLGGLDVPGLGIRERLLPLKF
ncbi:MAG: hypothetical protein PHI18_06965 [bacterium]|nr:hypothetical protein [bacterium]